MLYYQVFYGDVGGCAVEGGGVDALAVQDGHLAGPGVVSAEERVTCGWADLAVDARAKDMASRCQPISGMWFEQPVVPQDAGVVTSRYDNCVARWFAGPPEEGLAADAHRAGELGANCALARPKASFVAGRCGCAGGLRAGCHDGSRGQGGQCAQRQGGHCAGMKRAAMLAQDGTISLGWTAHLLA